MVLNKKMARNILFKYIVTHELSKDREFMYKGNHVLHRLKSENKIHYKQCEDRRFKINFSYRGQLATLQKTVRDQMANSGHQLRFLFIKTVKNAFCGETFSSSVSKNTTSLNEYS